MFFSFFLRMWMCVRGAVRNGASLRPVDGGLFQSVKLGKKKQKKD